MRFRSDRPEPLVANAWFRRLVVCAAALVVGLAAVVALGVSIDMSFRPTFSTEADFLEPTEDHRSRFGPGGSTDVVLLVDVGHLVDRRSGLAIADLASQLATLDEVAAVIDPTDLAFYNPAGQFVPRSLRTPAGAVLPEPEYHQRVFQLNQSAPLQRLLISDDLGTVAIAATLADAQDFASRRDGATAVTAVVDEWSQRTGYEVAVTGFPQIESVYAEEITRSVLLVIAVLYVIVSMLLVLYVRSVRLAAIVVSGVTLAMPVTLAGMRVLGQPFSIVNSQVLTLVAIVGIAHGLHQVDAYRKSRIAGSTHREAHARASETLAPSIATGLTTVSGFLALAAATMPAVRSFGFSTAVGVAIVYALNATMIPIFLEAMAHRQIPSRAPLSGLIERWIEKIASIGRERAATVATGFLAIVIIFALFGIPRLTVDQRVSEELPSSHPTHVAQVLHEEELSGYLGPNVWIRGDTDPIADAPSLATFVNELCSLEGVLHVASPLDLIPQRPVVPGGDSCTRSANDLSALRFAGAATPGGTLQVTNGLVGHNVADGITVRVRTSDFGTARALELLVEIDSIAAAVLPEDLEVDSVGDWVLAQNGMDQLSTDVGLSAGLALLVVLPMIGLALRNLRMVLAALLPTIVPVIATLAFLGATGITLRIGTAMILAICLGLAADDTIYIFTDVRRRIEVGDHPSDAMQHALKTSGPPALFSSVVLVAGLLSMSLNQLLVLRDMGIVAAFTMTVAVLSDLLLGPSIYHLLHRGRLYQQTSIAPEDVAAGTPPLIVVGHQAAYPASTCPTPHRETVRLVLAPAQPTYPIPDMPPGHPRNVEPAAGHDVTAPPVRAHFDPPIPDTAVLLVPVDQPTLPNLSDSQIAETAHPELQASS